MTNTIKIPSGSPAGWAVRTAARMTEEIIDRVPEFQTGSRGKFLQPRSLEVLDDLGVIDEVLASGNQNLIFRHYVRDRVIREIDPRPGVRSTPDVPYARGTFIPQWRVEEILRALPYRGLAPTFYGFEPGDRRASSGGETRLLRCSHGDDAEYTAMARDAGYRSTTIAPLPPSQESVIELHA